MRDVWGVIGIATRCCAMAAIGIVAASCSGSVSKYGVTGSTRVVAHGQPVPKGGGTFRIGDPYIIGGKTYVPRDDPGYRSEGQASWYGNDFHGRLTANGEVFDMNSVSAAHPTLPLPCYVRVTNLENRRSLVVRVNDRGPYAGGRLIDLSVRAAKLLGFFDKGTAQVRVEYMRRASLNGSDDNALAASLRMDEQMEPLVKVATAAPQPAPAANPMRVTAFAPTPEQKLALFGRGLY